MSSSEAQVNSENASKIPSDKYEHVKFKAVDTDMEEDDGDYDYIKDEEDYEKVRPMSEESIMGLEVVMIEGSVGSAEVCPICLDKFSIGLEARRMPCSHIYHENCIL
jgi:hypothetical protein